MHCAVIFSPRRSGRSMNSTFSRCPCSSTKLPCAVSGLLTAGAWPPWHGVQPNFSGGCLVSSSSRWGWVFHGFGWSSNPGLLMPAWHDMQRSTRATGLSKLLRSNSSSTICWMNSTATTSTSRWRASTAACRDLRLPVEAEVRRRRLGTGEVADRHALELLLQVVARRRELRHLVLAGLDGALPLRDLVLQRLDVLLRLGVDLLPLGPERRFRRAL